MTIQEKFDFLGKYKLTFIQRPDQWKHWRLWLNREEESFEYICEKPTIEECLDMAIEYIRSIK